VQLSHCQLEEVPLSHPPLNGPELVREHTSCCPAELNHSLPLSLPPLPPLHQRPRETLTTKVCALNHPSLPLSSLLFSLFPLSPFSSLHSHAAHLLQCLFLFSRTVERRRKLRISQNIKTLAETLTPPCHCGRAVSLNTTHLLFTPYISNAVLLRISFGFRGCLLQIYYRFATFPYYQPVCF
jgi:hypothetical protein